MSFKQLLFTIKLCRNSPLPSLHRLLCVIAKTSEMIEKENVINIPTLFVPGKFGNDMYQIVKPNISLEYIVKNCISLQTSCNHRNIKMNMSEVMQILEKLELLKQKHEENVKKFKEFRTSIENDNAVDIKSKSVIECNEKLIKNMSISREKLYDVEDIAMPLFAKIPNALHKNTPITTCVPEYVYEAKEFGFNVKSHVTIAKNMLSLDFSNVSLTAYYLVGELACLEQAIQSYFEEQLENRNFVPLSSVDFCKSFIVNACGNDPYSVHDCIILKPHGKEIGQRSNLVGASSFETACAYFVNMNIGKNILPMKYYSSGRFYDASHRDCKENSVFSVIQSNSIQCFIVSEPSEYDVCFDELKSTLLNIFSSLNLPYRIVYVSAGNLNSTESLRVNIEIWSPYLKKYIMCANVSQCDDFISKRLQMMYGKDFKTEGYLNVVHGFAVKISVLLGCIIENMQCEDGTFTIPDILKEYMFELS